VTCLVSSHTKKGVMISHSAHTIIFMHRALDSMLH
jgi:hypothetical protein